MFIIEKGGKDDCDDDAQNSANEYPCPFSQFWNNIQSGDRSGIDVQKSGRKGREEDDDEGRDRPSQLEHEVHHDPRWVGRLRRQRCHQAHEIHPGGDEEVADPGPPKARLRIRGKA